MIRILPTLLALLAVLGLHAQISVTENRQRSFSSTIPAGDYSGITWLGGNRYAVVTDKEREDGFYLWEIDIDSVSGEITDARSIGFRSSGMPARDNEGIAYVPQTHTLWISGEADNEIREYDTEGRHTFRKLPKVEPYTRLPANKGLEALSYNENTRMLWTCNETDTVYIQQYDSLLRPRRRLRYHLDEPEGDASRARIYAHGIGTLCALDDGSLLVLEREAYVPQAKVGAWVGCKLYHITPGETDKRQVCRWRTRLTLLGRSFANYEGSCLGPTLTDGSRVMILVADSQHQYGGGLRDWLKTLRLHLPR